MSGTFLGNIRWTLAVCAFFWGALAVSMSIDMRRFRNCVLLLLAGLFTFPVIISLGGPYWNVVLIVVVFAAVLAMLCVPVYFIANGIVLIRKEGRKLANLLSLIFGVIIAFGEAAAIAFVYSVFYKKNMGFMGGWQLVCLIIALSVIYLCLLFLAFMCYTLFIQIIPRKRDFDYVIIHGCGLLEGSRISKLLQQRLDKAIEIYHKDPTPPMMLPSGGKGSDEHVSESEAMAQYLLDNGIPIDRLLIENLSATTMENLKNSKEIIDRREGRKYTALVTSNYHVYRCLSYCRKIGLKCTGIGSRVASYYWLSATIREFIAIMHEKRHLILAGIGWLGMLMSALVLWYFR